MYNTTYKIINSPEEYKYIFDIDLYKKGLKGAGFQKMEIVSFRFTRGTGCVFTIRGKNWRKETIEHITGTVDDGQVQFESPHYFMNIVLYYLVSKQYKKLRSTKQYEYEKAEIKLKYPEYFL